MADFQKVNKSVAKAFSKNLSPISGDYWGEDKNKCCVMAAAFIKYGNGKHGTDPRFVDGWFQHYYDLTRGEVEAYVAGYDELEMGEEMLDGPDEKRAYEAGRALRKELFR